MQTNGLPSPESTGELLQTIELSVSLFGDFLDDQIRILRDQLTLFPANGASAELTITLRYSDGRPAQGKRVSCSSRPTVLTGSEWRTVNGLAPRFGRGEVTIRQRVSEGIVRLGVRVTPSSSTTTDANGKAIFRLESFHVCGNDGQPATDEVVATSEAGSDRIVIKSAVEGLQALVDDRSNGLTTSGLVGRHLHPQVIDVLKAIGSAWQRVQGKPSGMPNFVTVTGATMRWGGLNPPHLTHRFGGTADIRPIGTREGPVSVGDGHYHREGTSIIVDFMRQTGASSIRFADNLPGVTNVDASHRDHIHVSWLQNPSEPWFLPPDSAIANAILSMAHSTKSIA